MKCTQRRNFKGGVINFHKNNKGNLNLKSSVITNKIILCQGVFCRAIANCFIRLSCTLEKSLKSTSKLNTVLSALNY